MYYSQPLAAEFQPLLEAIEIYCRATQESAWAIFFSIYIANTRGNYNSIYFYDSTLL